MKRNNSLKPIRAWFFLFLITVLFCSTNSLATQPDWQRKDVDWRITGGSRIKAVRYPQEKTAPIFTKNDKPKHIKPHKKLINLKADSKFKLFTQEPNAPIYAIVVDSPPQAGFIPWIAITATDGRSPDLEFEAIPWTSVNGRFLTSTPEEDYAIGILDTGAGAHLIGNNNAVRLGLFDHSPDLLTSNFVGITGVTGSVDAWVSYPIGLFIDGLTAIDPNTLLLDTSGVVGQTNVSIAVAPDPGDLPDLPTAIGTPLSVYFTTVLNNENEITITRNNEEFTGPDISFHESDDPDIPVYPNLIPLELRPLGGISVQYVPSLDITNPFDFAPASPSTIIGNQSQSLFFVHSVDLTEGENSAIDKDRFMLDTGAQVSVIGTRVAARLGLDITNPEFETEITGATGETVIMPGFYIDTLEIPALGQWLSFTNVPVILLDVSSPEGGTLDGIIGMNLFVDFNMVLRSGGLFLQDDPTLEFELIEEPVIADIAPEGGDGLVNFLDLATLAKAWLTTITSANWNPQADIAPISNPDGNIDLLDLAVLAEYWLESTTP